jgi:RNA polymerase sigma-70 factor (ECF subfamily)
MCAGEERAFSEFFDGYVHRLFRFAVRRVGREDDAEDVVQATLILAVRKIQTWRGEAALFTWLCTLCRHEVAAFWERSGRQPVLRPLDDDPEVRGRLEALAADLDSPARALERRETSERVQIILDMLPGRYGDVLEWKYIQGLSMAEIAARLSLTQKAVESLLTRAREAFREGFDALQPS